MLENTELRLPQDIENDIDTKEKILWQGKPVIKKTDIKQVIPFVIMIAVMLFIGVLLTVNNEVTLAFIVIVPISFAGIMGILDVCIFNKIRLKKTIYVITQSKVIAYQNNGKYISSELYFKDMGEIFLALDGGTSIGTIIFRNKDYDEKKTNVKNTEFSDIADVTAVYNLSQKIFNT